MAAGLGPPRAWASSLPSLLALVVLAARGIPWLTATSLSPCCHHVAPPVSVPTFPSYGDTTSPWVQDLALG